MRNLKDMKNLDREAEKRNIENDNMVFLLIIIGVAFLTIFIINPIAAIIGALLGKKKRNMCFFISIVLIVVGLGTSVIYSLVSMPIIEQLRKFLSNFYEFLNGKNIVSFILDYFLNPFYLVSFGLAILAGMYTYYHYSTDSKEDHVRRESRKRFKKGKETGFLEDIGVKKLKNDIPKKYVKELTNGDIEGTILGKAKLDDVFITDTEAAAHGMVVGTTGAGKTNVLLRFVNSCAQRSIALFFIDGKGDKKLPGKVEKLAKMYGRRFYHFDMKGEQSKLCYNPLYFGNIDNIKEKLIDTTDWTEPHYKSAAERVLLLIANVVMQILKETKGVDELQLAKYFDLKEGDDAPRIQKDILCLQDMLTPANLEAAIRSVKDKELRNKWLKINEKLNPEWYMGLEQRLALIAESSVGELVKETRNGIKLTEIMDEKAIILFSLNALENRNVTEMMGRLIVKDINTVISDKENKDVCYAIYDEHGAYISEDIESQFAMARSSGMRVITSTQDISDYKKSKLGDILMHKIVGNTNFKIIMKQNEAENAEYLAKTIGTCTKIDKTMSSDHQGRFKGFGMKNVEEFIVNPNELKASGVGEAVIIKKIPKQEIIKDVEISYIDFGENSIDDEDLKKNEKINLDKKNNYDKNKESNILVNKEIKKTYDPLYKRKKRKNID